MLNENLGVVAFVHLNFDADARVAWPQANDACIHGMCIQHPCQLEEIGRISSRIDIWTYIFCQVVVDWSFKIPALINLIPFLGDSHFSLDWGDLQVGQTPQGPVHFVVINVGGFGYPIGQKDSNSSPAGRTSQLCQQKTVREVFRGLCAHARHVCVHEENGNEMKVAAIARVAGSSLPLSCMQIFCTFGRSRLLRHVCAIMDRCCKASHSHVMRHVSLLLSKWGETHG